VPGFVASYRAVCLLRYAYVGLPDALGLDVHLHLKQIADDVIEIKVRFAMVNESAHGPIASFRGTPDAGRFRTEADMNRPARPAASVANDPIRTWWSATALDTSPPAGQS
jgi:hypothetical protein